MADVFRRCPRCHQLFQGRDCPRCKLKSAKQAQHKNTSRKLYSTWKWRKCRKNVLIKYQNVDIWLLGVGIYKVVSNPIVHHIIERDENPDLMYRLDNLITCSAASHKEIHDAYNKNKAEAIARIRDGQRRWEELNGD